MDIIFSKSEWQWGEEWCRWCSLSLVQFLLWIQPLYPQLLLLFNALTCWKEKCLHNVNIKIVLFSLVVWKYSGILWALKNLEGHFIESSNVCWAPTKCSASLLSLDLNNIEQLFCMLVVLTECVCPCLCNDQMIHTTNVNLKAIVKD